jgi:2-succinyl-5-enolpyruvyl-6-hydroxy-3-cyclohexene-1-carboxylate synthase
MEPRNRNELWARVLMDELARAGVRTVVVAPGSRSTPLVLAAAGNERLRTLVQIDERSAGFLALGIGKAAGRPAAVITTSGTAAANLLPAVVEACQGETPLLLLTADRPPRLRGADANQAIDQLHLFGRYTRLFQELSPAPVSGATLRHLRSVAARAVAAAVGDPGGPAHLNLPFDTPLEPRPVPEDLPVDLAESAPLSLAGRSGGKPYTRVRPRRLAPNPEALESLGAALRAARRPLLVAGPVPRSRDSGPRIVELARRLGAPLLADPLSGARYPGGVPVVGGYDLALASEAVRGRLVPDLILRFGATPTSAGLGRFLEELAGVPQVVVDGGDRWKDHLAVAQEVLPGDPALAADALAGALPPGVARPAEPAWLDRWMRVESAVGEVLRREAAGPFFEGTLLREVLAAVPDDALLFVSNSMPIRDLDSFGLACGRPIEAKGNRGASGIDGIVSTALGLAVGAGRPVVAVLGDLALLHDMNGLLAVRGSGAKLTLVVVQNDGGGIFHFLPIRDHEPEFTPLFATPHGRDVARVAALHDLPHRRVEGRERSSAEEAGATPGRGEPETAEPKGALRGVEGLREALAWAEREPGAALVEIRTDRDENRRRRARVAGAVHDALHEDLSSEER